ncbi:hypothetical protein DLM_2702 [Aquitalea magnusonii]|uniref:Uncharacterized protein n=1 Tax=Aquitalea magnusonii TaxID=332411 RepID=A0A3G9GHI7_9NEIS|nr:hypothetical protein [Aquitalea magnusonii]BBF86303.1 hypothetical protein DLM_2702 [Aquitalea magnusonii]
MSNQELDADTKQRLTREVELLVQMGMDKKEARRIVWDDYLDELDAYAAPVAPTEPEPEPVQQQEIQPRTPDPVMPGPEPPTGSRRFWNAKEEPRLTPEWLERNRQQLAQVKQIVGMRNR